jgi:triosephosphate isomerase
MRKPLIAGNWKMNTTVAEAVKLVTQMLDALNSIKNIDKVLCPPYISLYPVKKMLNGTSIELGSQNMYFKDSGAYTGEISPLMLKDLCKYVILGHSERRQYISETDSLINEKIKASLIHGLLPILCIGESLQQNETGQTHKVLISQIENGLKGINANTDIIIAYEPIWAIGTGKAATSTQAGDTISFIRESLAVIWGKIGADAIRILYGGSVTSTNIAELIKQPDIDGALVGGASLKPDEFVSIVKQTASVKS